MNVWIFQSGEPLIIDGPNARHMRAMNLSNALIDTGHNVVLWSTDFYHQEKHFRFGKSTAIQIKNNFEIRLIHSPGYKQNIGLARIFDHYILSKNLKRELHKVSSLPDVVFVGYPPIETAYVLCKYLSKRSIPFVVDVKDQWPSLFVDAFPRKVKFLARLLFLPYYKMAKKTFLSATSVSSMSTSFLQWVYQFSGRKNRGYDDVFPLAPPNIEIDKDELKDAMNWWKSKKIIADDIPKLCFIGSLSQAFDFAPVKEAAELAHKNNINLKIIICGDGNDADKIKKYFTGMGNVIFPGWIDRPKIEALTSLCIASLAPYKNTENFTANLPNKILDSLSAGLPILSPLEGEVRSLIIKHNVGLTYREKSGEELFGCILELTNDQDLLRAMSANAKKLYDKEFTYYSVYGRLVSHLEKLNKQQNCDDQK